MKPTYYHIYCKKNSNILIIYNFLLYIHAYIELLIYILTINVFINPLLAIRCIVFFFSKFVIDKMKNIKNNKLAVKDSIILIKILFWFFKFCF